jgi:hypothetical protein
MQGGDPHGSRLRSAVFFRTRAELASAGLHDRLRKACREATLAIQCEYAEIEGYVADH